MQGGRVGIATSCHPARPVCAVAGFLMRGPMFASQHGSAILETESQLTPRQSERILAEWSRRYEAKAEKK